MLDPISLALVQNRLDHICQQMGTVMVKSARSAIFNQVHDFSCFVVDADGFVIAQADGIPIHTGAGGFAVRAILDAFGTDIADGDIFVSNDPYLAGGNHLPDWVIARPIFIDGKLCAFTCNRAHQADIGGGAAGGYNSTAEDIQAEGIRLPVIKLYDKGVLRPDIWNLLIANSRMPIALDGDLRAMVGTTEVGAREVAKLLAEFGGSAGVAYFEGILDHAASRMAEAVEQLTDGTYSAEEWYDDDCFELKDSRIALKTTIRGGEIVFDFTGTDPQIRGFKNSSLANTYSSIYVALSSFVDASVPVNEGAYRAVTIVAPEGTIVNARPPAPLTMCTSYPAYNIIQAAWRTLSQAAPERACAGWGPQAFCNTAGLRDDGEVFVISHWCATSAGGATVERDGFNQIGPLSTLGGLIVPNAEVFEHLYPIRIEKQEFRCDTGGPGLTRGGTGIEYVVEIEKPVEYSHRAEGLRARRGFGINGGEYGEQGTVTITPVGEAPITALQYGRQRFGPTRLAIEAPAGGGCGNPYQRDPQAVLRDVRDGIVSREAAETAYGTYLSADGREVDTERTRNARERAA